ncbi:unnamed protein product [Alopecurus aequalis]
MHATALFESPLQLRHNINEIYRLQHFLPTDEEAVGYFLRCLLTGETLHGAEKLIHHADIYGCESKDLAARYPPVPAAVSTGDRFFFTTCKSKNAKKGRCERRASAGTWTVQTTDDVHDDKGIKIGQARTVSFKKQKKSTGWVMEEYRSLLPQAIVADGEKVLCRIHLAQNAPAAAREESNAYKIRPQQGVEPAPAPQPAEPVTVMASAHAQKRPAPVAAADMSSCKKKRIAAPVPVPEPYDCPMWFTPATSAHLQEWPAPVAAADPPCSNQMWMSVPAPASDEQEYDDCPVWFTPAAPVSTLPAAFPPEADDDTGRLSCSWEELFGEEHQVLDQGMEQIDLESDVRGGEQQDMDHFVQSLFADESSRVHQEKQQTTCPIEAQKIQQLASDELCHSEETSIDWESFLAQHIDIGQLLDDLHEVQKKSCNPYNADLQGQQHN